jgi:hypothetical protein
MIKSQTKLLRGGLSTLKEANNEPNKLVDKVIDFNLAFLVK